MPFFSFSFLESNLFKTFYSKQEIYTSLHCFWGRGKKTKLRQALFESKRPDLNCLFSLNMSVYATSMGFFFPLKWKDICLVNQLSLCLLVKHFKRINKTARKVFQSCCWRWLHWFSRNKSTHKSSISSKGLYKFVVGADYINRCVDYINCWEQVHARNRTNL